MAKAFSWTRLGGMIIKEFLQLRRDPTTFIMIISVPVIQIILFGYAINTNPKHLPTALLNHDNGTFSRTLIQAFNNTEYFYFRYQPKTEYEANQLLRRHKVLFTLNIPTDFSRQLVKGAHPNVLLQVDGTDPVSVASANTAAANLMHQVFHQDLQGTLSSLAPPQDPAELRVHVQYNPESITQFNVVPGLIGVILTMTLVMVTAVAITKERERGTMENLLVTPLLAIEIIVGKVIPFIMVGYIQVLFTLFFAKLLFNVPIYGSLTLLLILTFPFILANLFVGISISTMAKTQLQATQMGTLFFLPSLLLSGFAFPFFGMPFWAQWIGNCLPLTHFVTITRGIMLKGSTVSEVSNELWPIVLFLIIMLFVAVRRFQKTLD